MMLQAQRVHAGRIELACLLYDGSAREVAPATARRMRRHARGFGVIASFLSDGFAVDYISNASLASFKDNLSTLARQTAEGNHNEADAELIAGLENALTNLLDTRGDEFAERPSGNLFPWLDQH
jgi:hypothetical protein